MSIKMRREKFNYGHTKRFGKFQTQIDVDDIQIHSVIDIANFVTNIILAILDHMNHILYDLV